MRKWENGEMGEWENGEMGEWGNERVFVLFLLAVSDGCCN